VTQSLAEKMAFNRVYKRLRHNKGDKQVTVWFTKDLLERTDSRAAYDGIQRSKLIREATERYLADGTCNTRKDRRRS
jgi:metal-responsive CopG/Arc/MetJ family transcriptional regulator